MAVQSIGIAILLGSFFLMVILRFPIAYAVGLSSVFCMLYMGKSLMDVGRLMVAGISSFSLMAVPFFITMGVLMGTGGISEKLIDLANACVGWMRGGLAMVNIVASYFFGGISGSAVAKLPMEKVVKATLPFYICMIVALLIISFVPDASLWLPKALGGYIPSFG